MKKVLFLFLCSFALLPLKAAADGTEDLYKIESKANVKLVYEAILKKCKPDLSFKFKQDALNYLMAGTSRIDYGIYMLATPKRIYYADNTISWISCGESKDFCDLIKDEDNLTIIRCGAFNPSTKQVHYSYHVFENIDKENPENSIGVKEYDSKISDFEKIDKSSTGYSRYYSQKDVMKKLEAEAKAEAMQKEKGK